MIRFVDLHTHSSNSDGEKTPSQLIDIAAEKHIDVISLTDHDCIEGLDEMEQAAKKAGIIFISGVELSCFDKKDTHVLGYGFDPQNTSFKNRLSELQNARAGRMKQMVDGLIKAGFDITMDEVLEKSGGRVLGRPHVASVLVDKGYGKDNRDVFNKYIGSGCRYYVPYKKMEVQEGIELIHEAGGYAVLAHPKLLRYNTRDFTSLIKTYKQYGLDGIEVYYPCHYDEHIRFFRRIAKEFNLLTTCGGDYHNDHDATKCTMGFDAGLPGIMDSLSVLTGGKV